jgi:hypothetical protein
VFEIKIGYLHGVPDNPIAGLQLIDSNGDYSNYYTSPVVTTTTSATTTTTKPILYKINFDSNGGTGSKTLSLPYDASPSPPTVTKSGYSFTGWSPTVKNVTATANYKAQWSKNSTATTATVSTTRGNTAGTNNTQANNADTSSDSNSNYNVTNTSAAEENIMNGTTTYMDTTNTQNSSDNLNEESQTDFFIELDSNEKNNSDRSNLGTIKRIAAVVAASILLSLAIYLCVLASKRNPKVVPEPDNIEQEADENEIDDDF